MRNCPVYTPTIIKSTRLHVSKDYLLLHVPELSAVPLQTLPVPLYVLCGCLTSLYYLAKSGMVPHTVFAATDARYGVHAQHPLNPSCLSC